jgi:hypothetical protein
MADYASLIRPTLHALGAHLLAATGCRTSISAVAQTERRVNKKEKRISIG